MKQVSLKSIHYMFILGLFPFNKKLTHSVFNKESEHGGRLGLHQNRPKLKNKVKFLFKVKQFVV